MTDQAATPISKPQCACGNTTDFILREFRRSSGSFSIEDDRLVFRGHQECVDLELDVVLCGDCNEEVVTEDFDVED
jgi:hypothetical protein